MNDLVKQLPTFVRSAMYAYDLVMWSTGEYAADAQIRLQTAINVLGKMKQNIHYVIYIVDKVNHVKIMLNHTELQHIDSVTYLGITFDI